MMGMIKTLMYLLITLCHIINGRLELATTCTINTRHDNLFVTFTSDINVCYGPCNPHSQNVLECNWWDCDIMTVRFRLWCNILRPQYAFRPSMCEKLKYECVHKCVCEIMLTIFTYICYLHLFVIVYYNMKLYWSHQAQSGYITGYSSIITTQVVFQQSSKKEFSTSLSLSRVHSRVSRVALPRFLGCALVSGEQHQYASYLVY